MFGPDTKIFPVYGPPGTGKTTHLVSLVERLLNEGADPGEIAYVAYTQKAAREAVDRAREKTGRAHKDFPFFSTIHAMAYRAYKKQTGATESLMKNTDYKLVGERLALPVNGGYVIDGMWQTTSNSKGDFCIEQINLARAKSMSVEQFVTDAADLNAFSRVDILPDDLLMFEKTLEQYKRDFGRIDYSDMLDRAIEKCNPLPVKYAIIDEAQDLSNQQWQVCDRLFQECDEVHIAGDDDQSIYRFGGADWGTFLKMGELPEANVLDYSYRLNKPIYELANRIISRSRQRVPKTWTYNKERTDGSIRLLHGDTWFEEAPINEGEWLILVRNRTFAEHFAKGLRREGYRYKVGGVDSLEKTGYIKGIDAWTSLVKGREISGEDALILLGKCMNPRGNMKHGTHTEALKVLKQHKKETVTLQFLQRLGFCADLESPWYERFTKINPDTLMYLRRLAAEKNLHTEPRITISTIHGVKGGEADNVIWLPDMTRLPWQTFQIDQEDELRCAYVAVTRARINLYIHIPLTNQFFPYNEFI